MTYPLSQSQLSIYLACQGLDGNDGNYQQASLYKLPEEVDLKRLVKAFETLIKTHPYALSRIVTEEGMPRMEDRSGEAWTPLIKEIDSIDQVRPGFCRTMDLHNEPLFRIEIYKAKDANYLYLDFHHIIFDGASAMMLTEQISKSYAGEKLPAEPLDGFQIALTEERQRQGEEYAEAAKWYAEVFGDGAQLDSMILPDVYGAEEQSYRELVTELPVGGDRLKSLSAKHRCADSVLMTTAFGVTLAAWNADTRSCFTTIWNGRKGAAAGALTMSVHTMPVFVDAAPSLTVDELLANMNSQFSGSRARAFYSFADCARDLGMSAGISFGYQGNFVTETLPLKLDGKEIPAEDLRTNPPGIGLSVEMFSHEDGRRTIRFWYRPDKYSESILHNFAESFAAVLESMENAVTLADLKFVSRKQTVQINKFLPPDPDFRTDATLIGLYKERLAGVREQTAVVYGNRKLSYAEVDRLTDKLAAQIQKLVKPGSVVSIILGRNENMMIAPLAAIKAGCTYQPLDPSYPAERLQYMVKDANASLLIADPGLEKLIGDFSCPVISTESIEGLPDGKPETESSPDDIAILLYTSGTTGRPKGCMLSQSNICCFARNCAANIGVSGKSRMTAYASFGFDAFMGDLWTSLLSGAALYIIPEEIRLDLVALKDYFEVNGITHSFMTTQVATQFAINFPRCKGLKVLYTGGEKMASFPVPGYRLINCYGPTETSCYTVSKRVEKEEPNVPIGRPMPGVHTYIATKLGQRLPAGAAGELLLAGPQVGAGYLGLPEKTAEAFISNIYEKNPAFAKVYRTGDIVRWRKDGDIEFVGRKDGQVKVRGFRIELKEVETVILEYPGISDVTVQAFDEKGTGAGKFLAAYIVSSRQIDIDALNSFILERKPPYMVPAVTMQIDRIPLNVNQKVDRRALPEPQPQKQENKTSGAPFNILEQEIADIIKQSVNIEGFSLTEPLIYYGLSSLSALRLATELYKKYGVQMNMDSFVKTASLQSIENEVLKAVLSGRGGGETGPRHNSSVPQPLTFQQAGVYFDCMKAPMETIYNIPMCWTLPGNLDGEKVLETVITVLKCHPQINTRFEIQDGRVMQIPLSDEIKADLLEIDAKALKKFKNNFTKPFNLSEGPLYRVSVVKSEGKIHLLTDFHHLVFDGRSYDIFISQLTEALEGKAPAAENYTYLDYAQDQHEARDSEAYNAARDFFAGRMSGCEGASGIINDLNPSDGPGKEAYLSRKVDAVISRRCLDLEISPASYYLAAAFLTAAAYCGSRKMYLCTISNGRSDLRTSDTFGMFVNTLALSSELGHGSVDEYLKETDRMFSETLRHEYYPFAQVAADFDFQPQIMVAYQVGVLQEYSVGGLPVKGENLEIGTPKFPLSIFIDGREGEEHIVLAYDDSRFSKELMQHFADTMECVVRGLLEDKALDEVQFVDGERLAELDSFNRFKQKVDDKQTIVSLFRAQAERTPDAQAVCCSGRSLSYGELDRISGLIAAYIAERGLGRENAVSILTGRSELMAVTALGVLKAGCAYQPLDPSYPSERLNFMIQDASAGLLIADEDLLPVITEYKGDVLLTSDIYSLKAGGVPEGPDPESLFILLYTSGSTGVPKGCMLEHRNLVNFCAWYRKYYDLKPGDNVAAYASFGFDACMMDLYPALTCGACVHIIDEETRHDMAQLSAFMTENHITHSFMTTQVGVMFARNFPGNPSLRHLSVGGEKLVSINPPAYSLHNGYGPTECTIFTTIFDVKEKEENIPIGHPLDNMKLYVVDDCFRRLPVGAAGEMLISGPQVGRGYLNRPEKTAESFISNPFDNKEPYGRVYRSGDIVRYRIDGNIEFVGRNDGQVKIRGFRVETKEVEAVIREFPGVRDVTVQAFDAPSGGKFIAAYIVADGKIDNKALSAFILERKPPYMVPASFNQIEVIPLNVNQKVDRKALPAPVTASNETYVEPSNDTERTLCEVFAKVLDVEKVGAADNFFDLGGSSLMVTNVMVEAEKLGLKFSYGEVFIYPSARALAAHITGESAENQAGEAPEPPEMDIRQYDYSAINDVLAGNTLEALVSGEPLALGRKILLTGATGFLGIHILRELLEHGGDDTVIWCLLRSKGGLSAEKRLAGMLVYYFEKNYREMIGGRIQVAEGDISRTDGLEALEDKGIDMVINCAANVRHFSKGNDIEEINYGGVKNLVAFCEKSGARFIQVSTESVGGMTRESQPGIFLEQQLWTGQNTDNQYVRSKFLAERFILEHMAAGTLRAKIMRAGNLSPRAEDGEFQANFNANTTMGRIKAYKMLGACPYPLLDSKMEFSPIDETARAIVLLSGTPDANCVFHVSNDHLLPMDDILSRIRQDDGSPLKYVEMPEFYSIMKAAENDPEKTKVLSSIIAYANASNGPKLMPNFASTAFTMQVLHRLGFRWNETSSDYVDMIFEMLASLDYFKVQ